MNGIAPVKFSGQNVALKPSRVSFGENQPGQLDKAVDAASEVIKKFDKNPDENSIKAAFAAIVTVVGLFIAKQAPKIKEFISRNQNSPNKFLKVVAIIAGAMMSVLSVLGASSLFKEKIESASKDQSKDIPPVQEDPKTDSTTDN